MQLAVGIDVMVGSSVGNGVLDGGAMVLVGGVVGVRVGAVVWVCFGRTGVEELVAVAEGVSEGVLVDVCVGALLAVGVGVFVGVLVEVGIRQRPPTQTSLGLQQAELSQTEFPVGQQNSSR